MTGLKIANNCSVSKITFNFLGSEAKEVKEILLEFKHAVSNMIVEIAFGYEHLYEILI